MLSSNKIVGFVATKDFAIARSFYEKILGIWGAPGGARVAWFKDPDGNLLSVSQNS
jgi:predicted enzyme related to lactoylglutathione lyase